MQAMQPTHLLSDVRAPSAVLVFRSNTAERLTQQEMHHKLIISPSASSISRSPDSFVSGHVVLSGPSQLSCPPFAGYRRPALHAPCAPGSRCSDVPLNAKCQRSTFQHVWMATRTRNAEHECYSCSSSTPAFHNIAIMAPYSIPLPQVARRPTLIQRLPRLRPANTSAHPSRNKRAPGRSTSAPEPQPGARSVFCERAILPTAKKASFPGLVKA
ncbi:hypothetical protein C8T65DRAFT_631666 [Cerioporus squamosus]|nr:hypothetical protein C8T65DRAFT_631666 [Cerioporus squamosus]